MDNQTTVSEFFLMGVSRNWKLQILHFVVFLAIYLAALMGNLLIMTTISLHHHLHTPMYFFLKNLSFLDICFISVTIPKSFINSLMNSWAISFQGCVAQLFLFLSFIETELLFLTIMTYDLYIAICNPLNYTVIVNKTACHKLACGSWLGGGVYSALNTASKFSLPFCGSLINQFFCNIPPLLKLSCSHPNIGETVLIAFGVCVALCCFAFITVSYIHIFSAVLKIPSVEGRHKTFSTCLPHLTVVSLFLGTGIFSYLMPTSASAFKQYLMAVFYSVVPPLINPIIYSLRNQEIKMALGRVLRKILLQKKAMDTSF
uniref:G-protein coupled receptors family 1 profile domain-containing protein n=1 Tax=Gopherus agassizii TaxID=38772 RepID=A0A452HC70_9SAUR